MVLVFLGVLAAGLVAWPLLRPAGGSRSPASPGRRSLPVDDVPDELAELELDRAMGRVSEADYERLKVRLAKPAPPAEGGAGAAPAGAGSAPAAAVSSPAGAVSAPRGASGAEELVRRWTEVPPARCASCGPRPEPAARFCSRCGAPVA